MFGKKKDTSSLEIQRHGRGSYYVTVDWTTPTSSGKDQRTIYAYQTEAEMLEKLKKFKNMAKVREARQGSHTK